METGTFSERLRSEIEYRGLTQKELATKAGIKKRALDMYLGNQQSMPPADVAVRIASALGVSVEYLVTGFEGQRKRKFIVLSEVNDLLDDIETLPREILSAVRLLVHSISLNREN